MKDNTLNRPMNVNISVKVVAAVIVFVLLSVGFYFYVVAPKIQEIQTLNSEIAKAEEHLNLLLLAQERLSSIEREINLYNERLATLKQILPVQSDEFLFSEEFVAIANQSGGKITSLNFEKSQGQSNLPTFTLTYEAPKYENVTLFNQLVKDRFPQIVTVKSLVISKFSDQTGIRYTINMKGSINLSQRK